MLSRSNPTPIKREINLSIDAAKQPRPIPLIEPEDRSPGEVEGRSLSSIEGTSIEMLSGVEVPWCFSFLEKRGKELFGNKFKIQEQDHPVILKLLIYFIGDKEAALKHNIDLQKGILLSGPIGCGKTALMSLMRFVPPPERNHVMKSCRDVSFEFIQEGYEVISRYSRMSFSHDHPKIYCFDDLGTEQSLKYYGNECNVMGEILLSRYDFFVSHDMITHLTTNLSASEIESLYGNRARSRLREMFNLIAFDQSAGDRRL